MAYYYSRPYLNEIPPHFIYEIKTKRYDNDVIAVNVFFHKIDTFSCLASGFLWDTTNRQLLFAVRHFQFQVAKVSNLARRSLFRGASLIPANKHEDVKYLPSTSKAGRENYFLPLNVRLYNCLRQKTLP